MALLSLLRVDGFRGQCYDPCMGTAPKFVVGTSGRREAVLLDMNQYRRMLQKIENLEDALALDRAERTSKKLVPYEDVRRRLKRAGKL